MVNQEPEKLSHYAYLTDDDVRYMSHRELVREAVTKMHEMHKEGMTHKEVGKFFDLSHQRVVYLLKERDLSHEKSYPQPISC